MEHRRNSDNTETTREHHRSDDKMTLDHVQRIVRLEGTVKEHTTILQNLVPTVNSIDNNLKAIKWTSIGAVGLYCVQKFGILAILTKIFS